MRNTFYALSLTLLVAGVTLAMTTDAGPWQLSLAAIGAALTTIFHEPGVHGPEEF